MGRLINTSRASLLFALALFLVLAAALIVVVRWMTPPKTARLLPESDAIVYINVKPIRAATHFDRNPVSRSADLQSFVEATGIVPERDLNEAAFALHRMSDPSGPNGPVGYSEVFEGRFDGQRLDRYLASQATARETYDGHTIYTIPITDGSVIRPLRVTALDGRSVAASNMPTPEQIHSILDRHRSWFVSGSALLTARFHDVPLLASAWGVGRLGLPFSDHGAISAFGLQLPLATDTDFVASLRYTGSLHLRIEQIADSEADAERTARVLGGVLGLFKSIQKMQQPSGSGAAYLQMIASLRLERHKDRVILTATIPTELLRQLTAANSGAAASIQ
ncbi:MAG: hypothetical protein FWD64_10430 [Acidobacteriaceae bacterium]|nr:hypothetical protein [Acidobacteriaceae bacterium]